MRTVDFFLIAALSSLIHIFYLLETERHSDHWHKVCYILKAMRHSHMVSSASWDLGCRFRRLFQSLPGQQYWVIQYVGDQQHSIFSLYQHTKLIHLWNGPVFSFLHHWVVLRCICKNHCSTPTSLGHYLFSTELRWDCSDISISFNVSQPPPSKGSSSHPRNVLRLPPMPQGKSSGGPFK